MSIKSEVSSYETKPSPGEFLHQLWPFFNTLPKILLLLVMSAMKMTNMFMFKFLILISTSRMKWDATTATVVGCDKNGGDACGFFAKEDIAIIFGD